MFDTKLVMRHKKDNNPYGLKDEKGRPYTRKETVSLFIDFNMDDDELSDLNKYIRQDRKHHTFDSWNGWCDTDNDSKNNIHETNKIFRCSYENDEWEGKIIDLKSHLGYIEFTVTGRGSSIRTYIGNSSKEIWASFPEYNRGCSLAMPSDIFWNTEKLTYIFDSVPDGITVANAISIIGDLIIPEDKYYYPYDMDDDVMF
ncbi:MAG: hypothetical protein LUG46_01725 [Erysipelotrichaceae bacterium]|nr:hypothetical protein [Erysipelotrichaceae bacterium]